MAAVDRPWWLEPERVRVTLTMASLERVDATAKRLGVGRARVVDALVRVVPESELDAAVLRMVDLDAQALTAWRESSTPS